jgi:hypothetical protein
MPDPETEAESPEQQQEPPESKPDDKEPDCSSYPPQGDCPSGVSDLECTAKGDEAKAAYNKTFADDLKNAKDAYETTRGEYRKARHDVRLDVEDLRNQIRHLVERIGCQIEQKRVRKCLDDAFCDVLEELKCCPKPGACCTEDCDFPLDEIKDLDFEKLSTKDLIALIERLQVMITEYQARIDKAKKCFEDLKGEPAALKKRVQDAKDAVNEINQMLATTDAATLDLKTAYAKALVWQWKLGRVWGGFKQVQDFVECLCDALTCWTEGCEAVYKLTGVKAIAECKAKARQDRCDTLRNKTVEQILAGYDRRCAKQDRDGPSDGTGGKHDGGEDHDDHDDHDQHGDHDDDDDCGCHHHHHHHRHHHHHHRDCGCHDHD